MSIVDACFEVIIEACLLRLVPLRRGLCLYIVSSSSRESETLRLRKVEDFACDDDDLDASEYVGLLYSLSLSLSSSGTINIALSKYSIIDI